MRPDTVIINSIPGETRIALLARGQAIEFLFDRADAGSVEGAVFAGRVTKVNRDLNAAFIDIGTGVPGFLAAADARRRPEERIKSIADVMSEGDRVLVQADREAMDGKGPRLTCRLALAGRYLTLLTGGDGLEFSRALAAAERQRLDALDEMLPAGLGVAFHPAAGGAALDVLKADLTTLIERLDTMDASFQAAKKAPALLMPAPGAVARALSLAAPNARIVTDDAALAGELDAEAWSGKEPLFEAMGAEAALEAALAPVVPLPSGGRMIVSETPALTAIDIDTGAARGDGAGQRLAAQTNREAVKALGRELRLRNLSGQILIDFLAMKGKKDRHEILSLLRGAISADPVEGHILGYTALGLVEMTRRRRGPSLAALLTQPGGRMPSAETAALAALRQALATRGPVIVLTCAPLVADLLNGDLREACRQVNERLGGALKVTAEAALGPSGFEISAG